jgi:hypothetical protein
MNNNFTMTEQIILILYKVYFFFKTFSLACISFMGGGFIVTLPYMFTVHLG